MSDIPYYQNFIDPSLLKILSENSTPVAGVDGLSILGETPEDLQEFETPEALQFVCNLYDEIKDVLAKTLDQRLNDRRFIDEQTLKLIAENQKNNISYLDPNYKTIIGTCDHNNRIVVGPASGEYKEKVASPNWRVAEIPEYLQGFHLTLFGPADTEKMSINAMNAWHRKPSNEAEIVTRLVEESPISPKWGADNEDSKTPTKLPFLQAIRNLTGCFKKSIHFEESNGKQYKLRETRLSHPIKRFPGLALPDGNHIYRNNPLPLHLYDFALHVYHHWDQPEALCFYVPKLENEEEARYVKHMIEQAEKMIQQQHSEYQIGTIRLLIVLENPRAIFRAEEIMYELTPYFAGASLGWHDYLASTASLFQKDPGYKIPVKADPDIVINHIKESHDLLNRVIGKRGGIKIGGMYGVLPEHGNPDSLQITMIGFIRDVITQLKRGLDGFWIAHPDFIRPGIALIESWKLYTQGNPQILKDVVAALVEDTTKQKQVIDFIEGEDVPGLDTSDPLYPRALLAADMAESQIIANNDPEEVRYNVFQALQYLADWLTGNGCVALPAQIKGVFVRIMDDLATTERSRREVWAEVYHQRFSKDDLRKIFDEEMAFIRENRQSNTKKVQVLWSKHSAKWYPIAEKILFKLMSDPTPVEFATEYLMPFTFDLVREQPDPWKYMQNLQPQKFQ